MKPWHGSCIGAILVLLIGGSSLIFLVLFGGAMIAAISPVFDRRTAYVPAPTRPRIRIMTMALERRQPPVRAAGQDTSSS